MSLNKYATVSRLWPWALVSAFTSGLFVHYGAPRPLLVGWLVYQAWWLMAHVANEIVRAIRERGL